MESALALEVPVETAGDLSTSAGDQESTRKALDDLITRALAYRTGPELKALFDFIRRFPHIAPYNAMLLHVQNPGIGYALRARFWERDYRRRVRPGARADARKRLSLVQDVSVNPSEPQPKPQQASPRPWPKNLDPSISDWLLNRSVSDPTLVTPLTFPRRDRSERKSPQEIVQKGLPEEKLEAFLKLARHLIREGVDTPEKLASIVPENLRSYAQALWDSLAIVNPKLRGTHDWQKIFARAP